MAARGSSGGRIVSRDNGEKAFMARLAKMNRAITLGVHGEEGVLQEEGGATVADVATWNEFGTDNAPARPSITAYADEKGDDVRADLAKVCERAAAGKIDLEVGLKAVALKHENGIKAKIRGHIPPSNEPSTIARKGSSTPLINTGQFVASILGKVE